MKRTTIITLLLFAFTYTISGKSLYINELMPSNVYGIMDELYDFPDSWVEIYNDSEADINIKGYSFAESTKNKVKWVIPVDCIVPAKGFKLVYFDKADTGLHAGFRLDINGGKLYLYDPATVLVDYITYDKTNPDLSFGRVSDGGNDWGLLTRSTPGESNKNSQIAAGICAAPNFNNNNTFYTNQAIFRVTNNEPGSYMVYTTDGSEPREDGKVLNASLKLTESRVCKVKVFKEGYAPSPTVTKTFLINMRQTELPIISLGMDSKHLKDDMIGIYVIGKNGVVDNCYDDPRNYNQPWRRPMTFEYFERSHVSEPELNQTGELRIAGGCSRNNDQKTVILYANKRFGEKRFNYDFFEEKPGMEIKSIMLRNTGNDYYEARLRDPLAHALVAGKTDIDYQAYKPAIVFINGEYWGMQNIRERTNEDYILANYKLEEEEIDLISLEADDDLIVSCGDGIDYDNFIYYVRHNDTSKDDVYENICNMMDMDQYINYMAVEVYMANRDWLGNNTKIWKAKENGKWRWILFDVDFGFGLYGNSNNHNTLLYALREGSDMWLNTDKGTILFKRLCRNETFKNKFIEALTIFMGDFLRYDNISNTIDSLAETISPEADYHNQRWRTGSQSTWMNRVESVKSWNKSRSSCVINHLKSRFSLDAAIPVKVSTTLEEKDKGDIKINDFAINSETFDGNLFNKRNYNIIAAKKEGYKFINWRYKRKIGTTNYTSYHTGEAFTLGLSTNINEVELEAVYENMPDIELGIDETCDNYNLNINTQQNCILVDYRSETATDIKVEIYSVNGSAITKYYDANEQTQHSIRLDIPDSQGNIFIVKIINKTKVITRKVTL